MTGALGLARFLKDGMPGVSARAAVAPGHDRIAPEHLLDADVMVGPALGAHMGNARFFGGAR